MHSHNKNSMISIQWTFAEIPPSNGSEAVLIVRESIFARNWSGQITGSDSITVSYNRSGMDAIIFPCVSGKPYSLKIKPTEMYESLDFLLTDNTRINLLANTGTESVADNSTLSKDGNLENKTISLSGTCSKLPDEEQNLIDYLYRRHPEMVTSAFLDEMDAVRQLEGGKINVTGLLTPMTVGKYLDLVSPKTDAFWIGNNMGVDSNGHTVKRFPAKYNLALRLKKVPSIFKNICYYFTYNTQNRANGEIP